MIQVKFKNLGKSEFIKTSVIERTEPLIEKFEDLRSSKIQITVEMENSTQKAGPDHFKVKYHIAGGRYDGITVEKSDANIYVALADVLDHMLEVLNRFGDRMRVKERQKARDMVKRALLSIEEDDKKVG
jgi:ribosome-associated translation inhibitor RaiA